MTTIVCFSLKSKIHFKKVITITNSISAWFVGFINFNWFLVTSNGKIVGFRHINPSLLIQL